MKTNKTRISQRKIAPASLPARLEASPLFVLYVGQPTSSAERLLSHFDERAGVGWINALDIDANDAWTRLWIAGQRANLGWLAGHDVPEGYYLFIGGYATSYDSGLVDVERDRAALILGLGTAAIALAIDPESSLPALTMIHEQAVQRVIAVFDAAIDERVVDVARAFAAAVKDRRRRA